MSHQSTGRRPGKPLRAVRALPRLARDTVRVCLRYRVTGLASEAAFFALMSLPPLVLGLVGGLGLVGSRLGSDVVDRVVAAIEAYSARFLTAESVDQVIAPTVDAVFRHGRVDLVSIGFLLSLWSGSRALNVFVDTISIMYGQSGVRGIVRTRALSFSLYTLAVVFGALLLPLVLIGPSLLGEWAGPHLPPALDRIGLLYWPVVAFATIAGVTSLFHVATPRRTPWLRDLPGGVLTLVLWVLASVGIREWIGRSIGGSSVYGPLSSPIVIMVWLYFIAISVLIGAAFNAAIRETWPVEETSSVPARVASSVRGRMTRPARPNLTLVRASTAAPAVTDGGRVVRLDRPRAAGRAPLRPATRSVFGPLATGLVAQRPAAPAASDGLDAHARHGLVSVTTQGG